MRPSGSRTQTRHVARSRGAHATVATLTSDRMPVAYFTGRVYTNNWWSGDDGIPLGSAPNENAILKFAL